MNGRLGMVAVVTPAGGPTSQPPPAAAFQSRDVVACSVIADRAVLAEDGPDGIGGVVVIKLSSGDVLYSRDDRCLATPLGLFPVEAMTVSGDGGLAVEQLTSGGLQLRNLSTGAVTPWPGGGQDQPASVSALFWHGRRAVTDRGVVDLGSGRAVWRPLLATPMPGEQNQLPGATTLWSLSAATRWLSAATGMRCGCGPPSSRWACPAASCRPRSRRTG